MYISECEFTWVARHLILNFSHTFNVIFSACSLLSNIASDTEKAIKTAVMNLFRVTG